MKQVFKVLVLVMFFAFAGMTQVDAAKNIGGIAVLNDNGTVFVVSVSAEGGLSVKPVVPSITSAECDDFCAEACDTGQIDVCYCGRQSFPCDLYGFKQPPIIKQ